MGSGPVSLAPKRGFLLPDLAEHGLNIRLVDPEETFERALPHLPGEKRFRRSLPETNEAYAPRPLSPRSDTVVFGVITAALFSPRRTAHPGAFEGCLGPATTQRVCPLSLASATAQRTNPFPCHAGSGNELPSLDDGSSAPRRPGRTRGFSAFRFRPRVDQRPRPSVSRRSAPAARDR